MLSAQFGWHQSIQNPQLDQETKVRFDAVLEKARRLSPLRQVREKLSLEIGNLQFNLIPLQMAGKTLVGERQRIEAEVEKIQQQEQGVRQEVRDFFVSLVKASVQPMHGKIAAAAQKRQQLRALLAEAAAIYGDLEQVQKDWKIRVNALKKVGAELSQQTDESYTDTIQEPSFISPWLPSPPSQFIDRARTHGDNIALILEEMARQIG